MQAFEYKRDNTIVGLLHQPDTGELLNQEHMKILENLYLKNNSIINELSESDRIIVSKICIIEDGKYGFNDITVEEEENLVNSISNIIRVYHNKLTQRIIVPQYMGQGPAIRHRPLYFGFGDNNKSIIVKYTTFGDFNNFNAALSCLNAIY
jgi:hypothetical protein